VHVYVRVLATPISLPLKTTGCFTVAWLEQTLPTYDLTQSNFPAHEQSNATTVLA
jgi:hypothetical protein